MVVVDIEDVVLNGALQHDRDDLAVRDYAVPESVDAQLCRFLEDSANVNALLCFACLDARLAVTASVWAVVKGAAIAAALIDGLRVVIRGPSTGPQTCKMLYATFLAAKVSGNALANVYFDSPDAPATCGSWEPWKSVNIRSYLF